MIGYLFLGLALLCGVLKGYCGKRSGGTLVFASDALAVNTVRMLACILIGLKSDFFPIVQNQISVFVFLFDKLKLHHVAVHE